MTSRSDRVIIRLTHRQAELLRALAYQFHNTPTSLAGVYVLAGMDHAVKRGAKLEGTDAKDFEADVLRSLHLARGLGLLPPDPADPEPVPGD